MYRGMSAVVFCIFILVGGVDSGIFTRSGHQAIQSVQTQDINNDHHHARQLLRQKRNTKTGSDVLTAEVVLNATEDHTHVFVHWAGRLKSEAVFVLTLKYNETGVVDSLLWRSYNYGSSYTKINFGKNTLVSSFYVSPANHTKMVFTDIKNRHMYTTKDETQTNQTVSLPTASDTMEMHPRQSDWILLYDYFQRKLFVTMDFGATWTLLQNDVNNRFSWAVSPYDDDRIVHIEVQPQDSEQAYYMRCTIPYCNCTKDGIDYDLGLFMSQTMLVVDEYIFVQKGSLDGEHSHMMVSHERGNFTHTYFPDNIRTKDFLILDADEGQVFVAVNHGDREGVSLYLSDPTGRYYVLSLANVHHRAGANWLDVDMHEVKGLNGTFLANVILKSSTRSQQRLKSMISFDKGGNWSEIPHPENCTTDDCAFLLRLDMANYMQNWILSEEKAPGLVIAHGHYGGTYEQDPINLSVFISNDGGWTWKKSSLQGVFHFNILDHGSVITAIKTGAQETTNKMWYTIKTGIEWMQDEFHPHNLKVDGVLNEADINTLSVSIYGHENLSAPWTMIKMNFSKILTNKCKPDDLNNWQPSDHDSSRKENCILGQSISYTRKKELSVCYYGEDFVAMKVLKVCDCEKEDFECDFGFIEQGDQCVNEIWYDDSYIAPDCTENQNFSKSQGYRKVGSDKCVGGVANQPKYAPTIAVCPFVAPAYLMVVANDTVASTGRPIHFHLSQKRGSTHTTTYIWNFNDTHSPLINVTGLQQAQQQDHSYSQAGIYYVSVTAFNSKGTNTSNIVRVKVEDVLHSVAVFNTWATKSGFPFSVSVSTNLQNRPLSSNSLHFLYRFGDEEDAKDQLTWNSSASHIYSKAGAYTLAVTAVNSVSAISKLVTIKVVDDGMMLQVKFSPNVDRLVQSDMFYNAYEWAYMWLENMRQELANMLAVSRDRLALNVNSTSPLKVDILVLQPPPSAPEWEMTTQQIVDTLIELVGNKSLILFRSAGLPRSIGDIAITSIQVLKSGGVADDKNTKGTYRAVYVAIPVVLLAAIVIFLVMVYYRSRRFRDMRRYSLVNQHEDTDVLLDDDDEPPLDLRPDNREERSRDENILDLGTGSHLVMVTGNGADDGPEHC